MSDLCPGLYPFASTDPVPYTRCRMFLRNVFTKQSRAMPLPVRRGPKLTAPVAEDLHLVPWSIGHIDRIAVIWYSSFRLP
jgi:hypothetical protein